LLVFVVAVFVAVALPRRVGLNAIERKETAP